jgi:hypothetical protein
MTMTTKTARTLTKEDLLIQANERAACERWAPLIEAAGLDTNSMDVMTMIIVAGYVMDDALVAERSVKFRTFHPVLTAMFDTDYVACLNQFSKEEKAALVARVTKKRGI